jgi:hypothetical protein
MNFMTPGFLRCIVDSLKTLGLDTITCKKNARMKKKIDNGVLNYYFIIADVN